MKKLNNTIIRTVISVILTICLIIGLIPLPQFTKNVYAADEIIVTSNTWHMTTGIYRVSQDVTVISNIWIDGEVTIILDEGKKLTAERGITVADSDKLTIEGKGTLETTGNIVNAGIGGGAGAGRERLNCGTVIINGGTINATGGEDGAAGIGGGGHFSVDNGGSGGIIIINGGTVNATGGYKAAGIGGGRGKKTFGSGGNITINGGTVTANGACGEQELAVQAMA